MDRFNEAKRLMNCFPRSFINNRGEFIADKPSNTYFNFSTCYTELEVKCKVLAYLSRAAYKTEPFESKSANEKFQKKMLDGINAYLGTEFTAEDMEIIYTLLGNYCNGILLRKFIESNYDMALLKVGE